ncbi:MAG: HAD-IIIA family hydrolase [Chitinophagaceae bacterium]|nr:HAD-IIIA family hydrolase [Chitinophagaceae bacterium]
MRTTSNIREAIILAGGLGTRLKSAVPDLPKCMAPVAGRPFIYYVINYLRNQGIERIVFSLGYKHEIVERYLHDEFSTLDYDCAIEAEPLGTGGAIKLAASLCKSDTIVVVNGDTIFEVDLLNLAERAAASDSICTLSLKPMLQFDRYGSVVTNDSGKIISFEEKKWKEQGNINGGLYLLKRSLFTQFEFPDRFSFETDFLQNEKFRYLLSAFVDEGYFIDIGIPDDFQKAQKDLQRPALDLSKIDKDWSLFLDRDGVINEDKPGSYIFNPEEFRFMDGVPEAFKVLGERFKYNFITTNQRGVGRGLMTEEMLHTINAKMKKGIEEAGGRLDAIYYATALSGRDPRRKPNPGMAVQARRDFPDINPSNCLMIGNNISDMQFGRNAGMYTVFLSTTNKEIRLPHPDIDLIFPDLPAFVKAL